MSRSGQRPPFRSPVFAVCMLWLLGLRVDGGVLADEPPPPAPKPGLKADFPPPPPAPKPGLKADTPPPDPSASGQSVMDALPWLLELQRRAHKTLPPTFPPGPKKVPPDPARTVENSAPNVHGEYDTSGKGPFQVEQGGDWIAIDWKSPDGLFFSLATYCEGSFVDKRGSKHMRKCFGGPWTITTGLGAESRQKASGIVALYPDPQRRDTVVIEFVEYKGDDLSPIATLRFKKLKKKNQDPDHVPDVDDLKDDGGFE